LPDITSVKQIANEKGEIEVERIPEIVVQNCVERFSRAGVSDARLKALPHAVERQFEKLTSLSNLRQMEAKRLVDTIQDSVLLPAVLEIEGLPFDTVTFQHVLRASQDFLTASWTVSHPKFDGRLVYPTCEFTYAIDSSDLGPTNVIHHGVTFADEGFSEALLSGYRLLVGSSTQYIDAYALRAIVCVQLQIQPIVFERCLALRLAAREVHGMRIFTELPFSPPPPGEDYVKVGSDRIGLIKLAA
jgi:hypothetical protein